jgi:hypothetical protein
VGDPLNGIRKALNHFYLLSYQEMAQRNAPAFLQVTEKPLLPQDVQHRPEVFGYPEARGFGAAGAIIQP